MRCILLACLAGALLAGVSGCGKSDTEKTKSKQAQAKDEDHSGGGYIDLLRQTRRDALDMKQIEPVRECVKAFQALNGRNPKDLSELKKKFPEIPDPPQGMKYDYRPATGEINLVPVTEE